MAQLQTMEFKQAFEEFDKVTKLTMMKNLERDSDGDEDDKIMFYFRTVAGRSQLKSFCQ